VAAHGVQPSARELAPVLGEEARRGFAEGLAEPLVHRRDLGQTPRFWPAQPLLELRGERCLGAAEQLGAPLGALTRHSD